MSRFLITLCFLFSAYIAGAQSPAADALFDRIPPLMARDKIPGLTIACIGNGRPAGVRYFGVADGKSGAPVTDSTRFEAASLTKVVTAYLAMRMVGSGQLALDKPLRDYLGNNYDVGNDPRFAGVSARRVLSHTAGFPNWRSSAVLPILFTPGEKFQYSGEGFVLLSKVMEKITGRPFARLLEDSVFKPLGMQHTSITYDSTSVHARRHNWLGEPANLADYTNINAAASLRTTAADFSKFLCALLAGEGLSAPVWQEMMRPQSVPDGKKMPGVSWGLGLGLDSTASGKYAWHWGDQGDSKALFVVDLVRKNGVVYFTNSANGLSTAADILALSPGGSQPGVVAWVAYGRFDRQADSLYTAMRRLGVAPALSAYQKERTDTISEDAMNMLGYAYLRRNQVVDAIAIFRQNAQDHPGSYNTWDSLAEAYMAQGDKPQAITNYEKSLRMNPDNTNAVVMLKKLRAQ